MTKLLEITVYLIGISFITYWYTSNDIANSDWYSIAIVLLAIYGVSCLASLLKRLVENREDDRK